MDNLYDFGFWLLDLAVWSLFWYFVIKSLAALYDGYYVIKDAKELQETIAGELESLIHNVKPEQHDDVLYWFDEDTDKFLAQGKDIAEIRSHLKERFKRDVFMISDKILMAGPDFEPMDISKQTPEQVAEFIAKSVVPSLIKKHTDAA
jgi:hypothetical protein